MTRSSQTATSDRLDFPLVRLSLVLIFAAIIALLDTTIVNVAIDSLAAEFGAPLSTIQWVSTGYLLAVAVAIPVAGWAIDRFGGRRVWLAATSAFLAGSLLAGLAWSAGSLIAFRVLQGLGGGMIEPVALAMVATAAGPKRTGRAMSLVLIPVNLGPVIGPIIGGLIVDEVAWRWIFLVNIPVGLVSLALGWKYIPRDAPVAATSVRLDAIGVLLLSPGFAAVIYGLTASAEQGGFANVTVLASLAIGAALVAAYGVHALRMRGVPLLDVRLFANVQFTLSSLTFALIASIGFATIFLLPLYEQVVEGASALRAGMLVAPFGIGAAIGMAVAGVLGDRFPARAFAIAGSIVTIVSSLALSLIDPDLADAWIAVFMLLRGVGIALIAGPAMANLYRLAPPEQAPRATTAMYILFQVGASLGVAIGAIVVQARLNSLGIDRAGMSAVADHPAQASALAEAFGRIFLGQAAVGVMLLAAALLLRTPAAASEPEAVEQAGVEPQRNWSAAGE